MKRYHLQIIIAGAMLFATFFLWFFDRLLRDYGLRVWNWF